MKFLKYAIITVIAVVLLTAAAAAAALFLIDLNDYKPQIESAAEKQTGRKLTIGGEIDATLFPWLGLELGETKLANAPGFSDAPMAEFQAATVRAKLLPLLRGEFEVDTVKLAGLRLRLARNADGTTNYEDLGQPEDSSATEETTTKSAKPFALAGVEIDDAVLLWQDASSSTQYELRNLSIQTGELRIGDPKTAPVAFSMGFKFESSSPVITSEVHLSATLISGPEQGLYALQISELTASAEGKSLTAPVEASLSGSISYNQEQGSARTEDLSISLAQFNAQIAAKIGGLNGENPSYEASIASSEFSPRSLLTSLGIELPDTSDPGVLNRALFQAKLAGDASQVKISDLSIDIDESRLSGNASISDFERQALRFTLSLNQLNADRYLPPTAETAEPATNADNDDAEIDLSAISDLDVAGDLGIGSLVFSNLKMTNAKTKVVAKHGVLRVDPFQSDFYDGQLNGSITVDSTTSTPTIKSNFSASNIAAGPAQKDALGKIHMTGTGAFNMKITGQGKTVAALKQNLNGDLDFNFSDGAINGFNLAQTFRKARALYKRQQIPPEQAAAQETDFADVTGTAKIANGILRNEDLLARSPGVRLTGSGDINIGNGTLNYVARPVLVETSKGQYGADLKELKGIPIPIKCSGDINEPKCKLDIEGLLKAKANQVIEKERDKLEEKAKDRIGKELGRFFGRDKDDSAESTGNSSEGNMPADGNDQGAANKDSTEKEESRGERLFRDLLGK